jgi:hypothetical protein
MEDLSMPPNAPAAPPPAVPVDVDAFAAEHGVTEYVIPLLDMTRGAFPGAPVTLLVEQDADLPEIQWIVLLMDVAGWDADRLFAAHDQWVQGLMRLCPAAHRRFFTLGKWASA